MNVSGVKLGGSFLVIGNDSLYGRFHRYRTFKLNVTARSADKNLKLTAFNVPVGNVDVIVSKRALVKRDFNRLFLARLKEYFLKAFEFLFRTVNRAFGVGNIKLRNFCAGNLADILDFIGNRQRVGVLDLLFAQFQPRIGKLGIGKTEAEREQHVFFGGVVIAIADINAFPVFDGGRISGEVSVARRIRKRQRIGFRKLTGRIHITRKYIGNRFAAGLTAEIAMQNRLYIGKPRHFDR